MGGKSGDAKMRVASYYMSLHFGICHGPVDAIEGIYCGEKKAWEGSFEGPGLLGISKRNLFGGEKKEGGLSGTIYVLPGGQDQVMPEDMAARVGLTPRSMPAYRGITSLFFLAHPTWDGVYPDPNEYPDPRPEDNPYPGVTLTFSNWYGQVVYENNPGYVDESYFIEWNGTVPAAPPPALSVPADPMEYPDALALTGSLTAPYANNEIMADGAVTGTRSASSTLVYRYIAAPRYLNLSTDAGYETLAEALDDGAEILLYMPRCFETPPEAASPYGLGFGVSSSDFTVSISLAGYLIQVAASQ